TTTSAGGWSARPAPASVAARVRSRRTSSASSSSGCRRSHDRRYRQGERMKFGVFYELQLPKPWNARSEYELVQHALDQIELADRLGYDYAWEVEHHFLEEYSHSSAPEVFLAA